MSPTLTVTLTRSLTLTRYGLTVQNASFVNFDREGMVAVGGFAKARPAIPLYTFENCGGMETRFSGTAWHQSDRRVHWRWVDEALLTDLDGKLNNKRGKGEGERAVPADAKFDDTDTSKMAILQRLRAGAASCIAKKKADMGVEDDEEEAAATKSAGGWGGRCVRALSGVWAICSALL